MRNIVFGLITLLIIVYSCANPGYPTGGPKDEDPPILKKSTPEMNALNYKKDVVEIEFDEIIKLDDVFQKFVASPPLKKRPTIEARANKLRIKFHEEEVLQDNTTYTLDFADAVQDNNEGNPLESFVFSFSTGEIVDSFAIMGNVWDAFDLSPIEGTLVMAHINLNDTAFTHDIPVRLGKTDADGHFAIRNLAPGQYKVYAIEDGNRNYMFDQPGEYIAWYDSIVVPSMEYVDIPDTLETDSVVFHKELVYQPHDLKLFQFKEKSIQQYMLGNERKDSNTLAFFFNLPLENFSIEPVLPEYTNKDWAVLEPSVENDTMFVWITDSTLYNRDTLNISYSFLGLDTLNNPLQIKDTLKMYYFRMPEKTTRRDKKKGKEKVKTLNMAKKSTKVDLFKDFAFIMPTPVKEVDIESFTLYERVDTLLEEREFTLLQDSLFKRRYTLHTISKWTPGASYLLSVDSAAIEDVYGLKNDSIGAMFSVKSIDSYGTLLINMLKGYDNWLVQLLDNSDRVVQQKYVPKNGKFAFQYLKPGSYQLKLVLDNNKNGKWDTGKYDEKRQPENVYYYGDKVEVRANWDVSVEWNVDDFDLYKYVEENRKSVRRQDEL